MSGWLVGTVVVLVTAWLVFIQGRPRTPRVSVARAITDVLEQPDLPDADEPDDVDVAARLAPYTALRLSPTVSVHDFAGDDCPVCKGEK